MYNPGQNKSIGHPYDAIGELDGIAFDSAGYIYVCNFNRPAFGKNAGSVYAADPNPRTVHNDIDNPYAIALDPSDRLYVANTYGTKLDNTVAVFEPHSNVLFELLSTGISDPVSLVVDSAGNLYVANFGASDVTVYAPGNTSPSYTISDGIGAARALTLDPNGNLYVANASLNDVTIYAPGTQTPLRTISKQVNAPDALAIDPTRQTLRCELDDLRRRLSPSTTWRRDSSYMKITNAIYEPYSIAVDPKWPPLRGKFLPIRCHFFGGHVESTSQDSRIRPRSGRRHVRPVTSAPRLRIASERAQHARVKRYGDGGAALPVKLR